MQALEEGARGWSAAGKRPQHSPGLVKDEGTLLCHFKSVLKNNNNIPPPPALDGAVSYSVNFVFKKLGFAGSAAGPVSGRGLAAVTYNALAGPWLWKMCFNQSSTLCGSAQTNIFHFWNKDVYVFILAGFFFPPTSIV